MRRRGRHVIAIVQAVRARDVRDRGWRRGLHIRAIRDHFDSVLLEHQHVALRGGEYERDQRRERVSVERIYELKTWSVGDTSSGANEEIPAHLEAGRVPSKIHARIQAGAYFSTGKRRLHLLRH